MEIFDKVKLDDPRDKDAINRKLKLLSKNVKYEDMYRHSILIKEFWYLTHTEIAKYLTFVNKKFVKCYVNWTAHFEFQKDEDFGNATGVIIWCEKGSSPLLGKSFSEIYSIHNKKDIYLKKSNIFKDKTDIIRYTKSVKREMGF